MAGDLTGRQISETWGVGPDPTSIAVFDEPEVPADALRSGRLERWLRHDQDFVDDVSRASNRQQQRAERSAELYLGAAGAAATRTWSYLTDRGLTSHLSVHSLLLG